MIIELKISKVHYDNLEKVRFDNHKKYKYIMQHLMPRKYSVTEDTCFFCYADSKHYYLCFEESEKLEEKDK